MFIVFSKIRKSTLTSKIVYSSCQYRPSASHYWETCASLVIKEFNSFILTSYIKNNLQLLLKADIVTYYILVCLEHCKKGKDNGNS